MRRPWRNTAILVFVGSLLAGGLMGNRVLAFNDDARDSLRKYTDLITVAHDSVASDISYRDLVFSSIQGMLRTLDPHTNFLPPNTYSSMRERQQSKFYGLGILVSLRNSQLTVITPIEGTPASRLGIRAGDIISNIEGEPTEGMDLDEAVRRLKGPKGTKVNITIQRSGLDDPLQLTITRDEIPQDPIRYAYMITPETGYISLTDFNYGTGQEIARTIDDLKSQGMSSLLIDLRANGGGLLDQAIAVADQFLPEGATIVETKGRSRDSSQKYVATSRVREIGIPVVILVGGGTASAAEILAGAIQDHDIGLIVGTPTWGKGLVQTVYNLSYGSGLALTTAKYYTPSGRLIQRDYSSWFDYTTHADAVPGDTDADPASPPPAQNVYKTDLGRDVFGGGGITPDVFVQPDELAPFFQHLLGRNAFFDFAVERFNRDPIRDPDWNPPQELLGEFSDWLVENSIATRDDIETELTTDTSRDYVLGLIHAEIFNSAFGLEERSRVLARRDVQIETALKTLEQASELLAERNRLYESERRTSS